MVKTACLESREIADSKPALAFKLQKCRILCLEQGIAMYNVSLWSGEQCHLIHPSILWKLFWPSLAYICANRSHKTTFISFHLLGI